ncbi:MAG: WbqC family protein [Anaerolineae bacterium]|nr:WbqC family protein [Anaerolineae bacterium]
MKCVILQPSYIPWRGYFDQINRADLFVFYDDVQYDTRGWRNRNRIKTVDGSRWLSIPVNAKGAQTEHIPINQIKISWNQPWNSDHLKAIQLTYAKAPFFNDLKPLLDEFYKRHDEYLADFTIDFTIALARHLGIKHTQFLRSSQLNAQGSKTDRLVDVLLKVGADHYISGPSARDYIESEKFESQNIKLEYMDYHYPEYNQLYPPYDAQVSILDTLAMLGPQTLDAIKG